MRQKIREIYRILTTPESLYFKPEFYTDFLEEIDFLTGPLNASTINWDINISLRYKYIYVQTPKVACTTIKSTLQKLELSEINQVITNSRIHNRDYSPLLRPSQIPEFRKFLERSDIFKFCFVRNPYSRVLSAYLDKILRNQPQKRQILKKQKIAYFRKRRHISFEEFLTAISKISVDKRNPHWREQHYEVMYSKIEYDFIGYFESIEKDLSHVLRHITHGNFQNLIKNSSYNTNAKQKLLNYYTEETIELVNSIYAKDFEIFGYRIINDLPKTQEEWDAHLANSKLK